MASAFKVLRDWPAGLDAQEAVEYTGLASVEIQRAEREGHLVFKRLGPHGRKICPREQLDRLMTRLWADARGDPLDDMDFGEDGDD